MADDRNALMLRSEHRRILASSQEWCDTSIKLFERAAFWRGIGTSVWIAFATAVVGLYAGFYFGVSVVQ